jgi:hypothetical protein
VEIKVDQEPEFVKRRQKCWAELENSMPYPPKKKDIQGYAAFKTWYLEGDMTQYLKLIRKYGFEPAFGFVHIIYCCGTDDIGDFYRFVKELAMFLSKHKISFWRDNVLEVRDNRFIGSMITYFMSSSECGHPALYQHMWDAIRPDADGKVEFPMVLGEDRWKPRCQISMYEFCIDYFLELQRYLFSDEGRDNRHLKNSIHYLKGLENLHPLYFSTTLLNEDDEGVLQPGLSDKKLTRLSQERIRDAFGNFHGFKCSDDYYKGPLMHNDREFEAEVKAFLDSLNMPKEYYELVEFIKAHPDDYWQVSA